MTHLIKIIFFTLIFISSSNAGKSFFTVTNMTSTGRDGYLELILQNDRDKQLFLDCSSFLHGLDVVASNEQTKFFFLYEPECIQIFKEIRDSSESEQLSCLTLDFENKSWELFTGTDTCQSFL